VDNGTIAGRGRDIADIGAARLVEAQTRQQARHDQRSVALGPIGAPRRVVVTVNRLEQRADGGPGEGPGERLGRFGPADERHRISGDEFGGIQKVTQHIPGRPTPPDRRRLMGGRVHGERATHVVLRYVA
jgi:hypothetical protein